MALYAGGVRTSHLQIRVTPAEKAEIERAARRAGVGMSAYVLGRVLPERSVQWRDLLRELVRSDGAPIAFGALSTWLAGLAASELRQAVEAPPPPGLSDYQTNTVAAMVDHVCGTRGVETPAWTRAVRPLRQPVFGSDLKSLRLHLLTNSPAAFRRRNLFVDTVVGGQV